jgi:hypothetical protein
VLDDTLALQCHVEMTAAMVREWADHYPEQISQPAETVQDRAQLLATVDERIAQLQAHADLIYQRWIKGL